MPQVTPVTQEDPSEPAARPWRLLALIGVMLGAAGFMSFLIALSEGMRHVMVTSGGFCARGGPYVIANQCTSGDISLVFGGVMGMLVAGAIYAAFSVRSGGSAVGSALLMWGALFGLLGWNFIDMWSQQRHGEASYVSWLICGIAFLLMAAGGLVPVLIMAGKWLTSSTPASGFGASRAQTAAWALATILGGVVGFMLSDALVNTMR